MEETMYVALGKHVKESERNLMWALHNSRGMKICILHIHQPAQNIPVLGTKVAINKFEENQVKAYHEYERRFMHMTIEKYIQICQRLGVRAESICKETDSIEKGIVQLIYGHEIKWLVMGAAADKSYSRRMKEPKSKKAIHVRSEAPTFCQIWFVCKGNRIYTRNRLYLNETDVVHKINIEVDSRALQASPNSEGGKGRMSLNIGSVSMKLCTLGLILLILLLLLCDGCYVIMKFSENKMNSVM